MQMLALTGFAVLTICALTWVYGRILYPIPTKPISPYDDTPEVETRPDQRFRNAEGE